MIRRFPPPRIHSFVLRSSGSDTPPRQAGAQQGPATFYAILRNFNVDTTSILS